MSAKTWEIQMEMRGIAVPLDELRRLLQQAPATVRRSRIYQYYQGLADGRELIERLGGVA